VKLLEFLKSYVKRTNRFQREIVEKDKASIEFGFEFGACVSNFPELKKVLHET
jgi:hypothetical protein